jgi:hypothetical protein
VPRLHACTIAAVNYLAKASVLTSTFLEQHPDSSCTLLVVADEVPAWVPDHARRTVVCPTDIGFSVEEFHRLALMYNVTELATALKPALLRSLVGHHEQVAYLDPDMQVLRPLRAVSDALERAPIALTPHFRRPAPPNSAYSPTEYTMMEVGTFNLGFVAVTEAAGEFLDWWHERLLVDCVVSAREQLFVDQRWVNMAVGYWDVSVIRDPGVNCAYWNIDEAEFVDDPNGLSIGGSPLSLFHFSGLPPLGSPDWTTHVPDRQRSPQGDLAALRALFDTYRALCEDRERDLALSTRPETRYPFDETINGRHIRGTERRFVRDAVKAGAVVVDPFRAESVAEYEGWIRSQRTSRAKFGAQAAVQGVHTSFPSLETTLQRLVGQRSAKRIRRSLRR